MGATGLLLAAWLCPNLWAAARPVNDNSVQNVNLMSILFAHSMKFTSNTVSKPVVGKEAQALKKALKKNSYVANKEALTTVARIMARRQAA